MDLTLRLFPEVYTHGDKPARRGVIDKQRLSSTPSYAFGWVVSGVELFEALNLTDEPPLKLWLTHLPEMVDNRIYARWQMKGYDNDRQYSPVVPEVTNIGKDHILIYMACNNSHEAMDSIMANKAYHDECRDCLNNPKPMRMEPAWFRVGLRGMPKDFIAGNHDV